MKAFTYDDILMVPSYNHWESRRVVDISMRCKTGKLFLDLPLMTANMDTITETDMANFIGSKGGIGVLHRYVSIEDNVSMFKDCKHPVFVSIGCAEKDLQRAEALRRTLKCIREMIGDKACIMAGNVATYAGADYLASCSADIIKGDHNRPQSTSFKRTGTYFAAKLVGP
jgi:IMP dehydrogenase